MRKSLFLIFLSIAILFSSCDENRKKEEAPPLVSDNGVMAEAEYDIDSLGAPESLIERFSYAYGNLLAESLENASQDVDASYFVRGFLDYYGTPFFTEDELDAIFLEYQNRMLEEAAIAYERENEENLREAEEFLKTNGMRSGVVTTGSGLEYEVVRAVSDDGPSPDEDDSVLIDYTMTLLSGQVVDSSYDRRASAEIKVSDLIEGAKEGLMLMQEGERFRFWIHPDMGYGESGASVIGPNELLIFEVELVDILK